MNITSGMAAVVTGGASGLGASVTRALAARGAKVAIFDLNDEAGQAMATETGGVFCKTDVSDPVSVTAAFDAARAAHGIERVTVNCAGVAPAAKTVSRGTAHDAALYQKTIAVNLVGTFLVASQSAAGMAKAEPTDSGERGVIINTASIAAFDGQMGQTAYASSKGGVVGMTLPMARDLAKQAIRVMAIAPGIFATPMVEAFSQEIRDGLAAQIPFPPRLGETEEFAALALHIVENGFLNGEVIRLDGAVRMTAK